MDDARRHNRALRGAFAASVLLAQAVVPMSAATAAEAPFPYPSPPVNFATSHGAFGPVRGHVGSVPTLVIYGTFTDLPTEVPGVTAASIRADMFPLGTKGTIADYFNQWSHGNVGLLAAQETQGKTDDGVVEVSLGTNAAFEALGGFEAQGRAVVNAVAPFVDFRKFDKNGDGKITPDELVIVSVKRSAGATDNCGVTRGIAGGPVLNGMDLTTDLWIDVTTATNTITVAHEVTHHLLGTIDNAYTSGAFDIMGVTCFGGRHNNFDLPAGPGQPAVAGGGGWAPNAYNRLHLGWDQPTVVDRDGYYNVLTNSGSFLLYDPARGVNDYFLVEGRPFPLYDGDASDSGVVIWQVDETRYQTARGAYELVRPAASGPTSVKYSSQSTDAWNPLDPNTPQRTMVGTWSDGSPAKVAVRAIHGQANGAAKVWFDVRGPGILVDGWQVADRALVGQPIAVTFPVTNTGEQADTFEFRLQGPLPAGWAQVPDVQVLGAGQSGTASVKVSIAPTAAVGTFQVVASAKSTTGAASSNDTISVRVDPVADVSVVASAAPDPVPHGEALDYTLTVRNAGPSPATGVVLSDVLPGSVTYLSAAPSQGSCEPLPLAPGRVACSLGTVGVNATATTTIRVVPNAVGTIVNDASVTANELDLRLADNTAITSTEVVPSADLSIAKTAALDPVIVDEQFSYTLTVRNNGPDGATATTVTDALPPGVAFVSAAPSQGSCSFAVGSVTCLVGPVVAGGTATAAVVVRAPAVKGGITNTASVTSAVFDRDRSNNSAAVTTHAVALVGGAFGQQARVTTFVVLPVLGPVLAGTVASGPSPSVVLPARGGGPLADSVVHAALARVLDIGLASVSTQGGRVGADVVVTSAADTAKANLLGTVVGAEGVHSDCRADLEGAQGRSSIGRLIVQERTVSVTAEPNTRVDVLGLGVLIVNEQVQDGPSSVTVNALHLHLDGGLTTDDVIVSQSRCGIDR